MLTELTQNFDISPSIIYSLIEEQAGTLSKALLELCMNSVDSTSKKIEITINENGFTASDDGKGFNVVQEVKNFFGKLGFKHPVNDEERVYGKFGLGRAQIFSFAKTDWRTGEFLMSVDIKKNGLKYILKENLEPRKGCAVSGTFYEPLLPSEIGVTIRELTELALYLPIPLFINGDKVNKNVSEEKWDVETNDSYIKLEDQK